MENLSEKFGTLILIKGNIKMKEKKIHIQVGKSYIQAYLKNDKSDLRYDEFKYQLDACKSKEDYLYDYSSTLNYLEDL